MQGQIKFSWCRHSSFRTVWFEPSQQHFGQGRAIRPVPARSAHTEMVQSKKFNRAGSLHLFLKHSRRGQWIGR